MNGNMHIILRNIFAIFLLWIVVRNAYAVNPSFTVKNASGFVGEDVVVSVDYNQQTPGYSLPSVVRFNVTYNPAMLSVSHTIDGAALTGTHVQFAHQVGVNTLQIIVVPDKDNIPIDNGEIVQIPFRLLQVGSSTVSIINSSVELSNGEIVPVGEITVGTVTASFVDSDGDGVADALDRFPYDPREWADADNDGIGDNVDTNDNSGINKDAALDSDGDGLSNALEYQLGTNANSPDSDGDGINDNVEVKFGLNPLNAVDGATGANSDGDGWANVVEIANGTDPFKADTDGDGLNDDVDPDPLHAPNRAPIANAGLDQVIDENSAYDLDGTGSDDGDGSIVSYLWEQTAGPAVTLTATNISTPSLYVPDVATDTDFTFRLTVTDNSGASNSANVTLTAHNLTSTVPPVANAGVDISVNEGALVNLSEERGQIYFLDS